MTNNDFNTNALDIMKEIKTIEDALGNIGSGKLCLLTPPDNYHVRGCEQHLQPQSPKTIYLPDSFKQFFIDYANGRKKELWQSLKGISEMALIDIDKQEQQENDNQNSEGQ